MANGDTDFTSAWQKKFGGVAWGYQGKCDYTYIWEGQTPKIRVSRWMHGFSYYGSGSYPIDSTYILPDGRQSKIIEYPN